MALIMNIIASGVLISVAIYIYGEYPLNEVFLLLIMGVVLLYLIFPFYFNLYDSFKDSIFAMIDNDAHYVKSVLESILNEFNLSMESVNLEFTLKDKILLKHANVPLMYEIGSKDTLIEINESYKKGISTFLQIKWRSDKGKRFVEELKKRIEEEFGEN